MNTVVVVSVHFRSDYRVDCESVNRLLVFRQAAIGLLLLQRHKQFVLVLNKLMDCWLRYKKSLQQAL